MPRTCHGCRVRLPDAVNAAGLPGEPGGTRGVQFCPFCGEEVAEA